MDLYICWSIDCESCRLGDTELGRRALAGFCGILDRMGWKATLFLMPEEICGMEDLLGKLSEGGHEIALHLHPEQSGYPSDHLGVYPYEKQLEIITEALTHFKKKLGIVPVSVRPGYGSANDDTARAFKDAGIDQGSISFPGRMMSGLAANWGGAPLFAHYMHPYNRFLKGGLDFVELPVTVDRESMIWGGVHPQDLRVEFTDAKNHSFLIIKVVKRQVEEKLPFKAVMPFTHNIFEYSDASDFRAVTMAGINSEIVSAAETFCLDVKGVTMREAAAAFRRTSNV